MISLNNWTEIIVTSLSSGTVVAIVNHFLQTKRKKQEIIFENKSILIREKMKFIYEINKILNLIEDKFSNTFNTLESYVNFFKDNYFKRNEINEKLYNLNKEIENNELEIKNCLKNLNLHLNYFPDVKKMIRNKNFIGVIENLLEAFKKIFDNFNIISEIARDDELSREINISHYENWFDNLKTDYYKFGALYQFVLIELDNEGENIYEYLNYGQ